MPRARIDLLERLLSFEDRRFFPILKWSVFPLNYVLWECTKVIHAFHKSHGDIICVYFGINVIEGAFEKQHCGPGRSPRQHKLSRFTRTSEFPLASCHRKSQVINKGRLALELCWLQATRWFPLVLYIQLIIILANHLCIVVWKYINP